MLRRRPYKFLLRIPDWRALTARAVGQSQPPPPGLARPSLPHGIKRQQSDIQVEFLRVALQIAQNNLAALASSDASWAQNLR